jgi:hypothetical protein
MSDSDHATPIIQDSEQILRRIETEKEIVGYRTARNMWAAISCVLVTQSSVNSVRNS